MATYFIDISSPQENRNTQFSELISNWSGYLQPFDMLCSGPRLLVIRTDIQEPPRHITKTNTETFFYGAASENENSELLRDEDCSPRNFTQKLREINGEFLVIQRDLRNGSVRICTDRFASRPLFWFKHNEVLVLSTEYRHTVRVLSSVNLLQIQKAAIFEFFWFRRLFGQITYDGHTRMLEPATITSFNRKSEPEVETYWVPPSQESSGSKEDCVVELAESISSAVTRAISKDVRNGLMLSGGLDSRVMLMVGGERYHCITNSPEKNNEFLVAESLAKIAQNQHSYLRRPENYLDKSFDAAAKASHGMTQYYESQFLGYVENLISLVDNVQLGLFFDIFFCGHYMPKRHRNILGRNTLYFVNSYKPGVCLLDMFIDKVTYRLKTTSLPEIMYHDAYVEYYEAMRSHIKNTMRQGAELGFEGIRLWEYMHLTNLGRHYSMLMAKSLRGFMEVRLPALDNESYDLAFKMKSEHKINWSVYLRALSRLDMGRGYMKVRNSNTNLSAQYSLFLQTSLKFSRGAVRQLLPGVGLQGMPGYDDRSWPRVSQSLDLKGEVYDRLMSTLKYGQILELDLFDIQKCRSMVDETMSGKRDHSIFLNELLTIEYGFLKQIYY